MDISIFIDKEKTPTKNDLITSLGNTFDVWLTLRNFIFEKYSSAIEEWNYSRAKYGWNFRIFKKKMLSQKSINQLEVMLSEVETCYVSN